MSPEQITFVVRETLLTALEIASPFLFLALILGVLISVIQSMTQIQEMTLSFVPKMVAVAIALTLLFPWMLKILTKFTTHLLTCQWEKVTDYVQ